MCTVIFPFDNNIKLIIIKSKYRNVNQVFCVCCATQCVNIYVQFEQLSGWSEDTNIVQYYKGIQKMKEEYRKLKKKTGDFEKVFNKIFKKKHSVFLKSRLSRDPSRNFGTFLPKIFPPAAGYQKSSSRNLQMEAH